MAMGMTNAHGFRMDCFGAGVRGGEELWIELWVLLAPLDELSGEVDCEE